MRRLELISAVVLSMLYVEAACPHEAGVEVTIHIIDAQGLGSEVGTINFQDTAYGLLVTPNLRGLSAGAHALHLHEFPDCGPKQTAEGAVPGGGAGDHYDPEHTKVHKGPYSDGHLGDMPNILVEADGASSIPVIAPRLKVADLRNRAVMLHAGPDRYAEDGANHHHHDHHPPAPGENKGGARMYCGVIGSHGASH